MQDKTLEELYISGLGLTGDVPDVIPGGSPLRVIFAIGKGAFTNAPALTGALLARCREGACSRHGLWRLPAFCFCFVVKRCVSSTLSLPTLPSPQAHITTTTNNKHTNTPP